MYPDSSAKKMDPPEITQVTVDQIVKPQKTVVIPASKMKEINSPVLTSLQYNRKQTVKLRLLSPKHQQTPLSDEESYPLMTKYKSPSGKGLNEDIRTQLHVHD